MAVPGEAGVARAAEGIIAKAAADVLRDAEGPVARDLVRTGEHATTQATAVGLHDAESSVTRSLDGLLSPGPHAGESIPARGPRRDWTAQERAEIDRIGQDTGCHRCGATDSGTKGGHHVPDHQPPSQLNSSGGPQRLYPHCIHCSRIQGGTIAAMTRKVGLR